MKHLLCTIIALATLTMTHTATAQISIDKVEAKPEKISFRDTMKQSSASTDYFSLARHKA